ncbi:NAD-dependent epimerase/dehydratase family protein [Halovenus rubra]|uniref:NAD-dependent epimerase/dehydratase family protein n=2 Tax=Halovenus rubra TaxID=869890 RepID=A0ACC7DXD0_9EURY|nr:NAD-dependent epimerase/dehydratase family protein [Halovenus rubra]
MTTVAILGCGYVGLELGKQLQSAGIERVVGLRRSKKGVSAMESAGIEPVQGDLTDEETLTTIPDADIVVFAASAGRSSSTTAREIYVAGQKQVLNHFGSRENPPERYIYTSSTGVYGDHGESWVDEETPLEPESEREQALVDAETVAIDGAAEYDIDGTVARFSGLYGPDRYRLERYLEGPVTDGILNMIHRDDAAGAVGHIVSEDCARGEVVLVVDNEPVSKWELADWLATECNRQTPSKQTKSERLAEVESAGAKRRIRADKRCRNDKLQSLGYELVYPTFREGYQKAIMEYPTSQSE